jgi:hypothetical protein
VGANTIRTAPPSYPSGYNSDIVRRSAKLMVNIKLTENNMRVGTYTTLDTPCLKGQGAGIEPSQEQRELITKAKCFLTDTFAEIGAVVWTKINPHDFGSYPSFEIDYPDEITEAIMIMEDLDEQDEEAGHEIDETTDEYNELNDKVEKWQEQANKIENRYSEMFSEWL